MKRESLIVFIILIALIFTGCGVANETSNEVNNAGNDQSIGTEMESDTKTESESIRIQMDDAELVDTATHIVDANLVGMENSYKDHWMLLFEPTDIYKGDLGEDSSLIRVDAEWIDGVEPGNLGPLKEGDTYLLFLEKFISVYRDFNVYSTLSSELMDSSDENWDSYHSAIKSYIVGNSAEGKTENGIPFIESNNINDIIEFADSILILSITSKEFESDVRPTTLFNVKVEAALKGKAVNGGNDTLSFFNDQVEVGNDYVVLLSRKDDVYALASKENSVFLLDDAKDIPELKALLDKVNTNN